jgi:molybdopterin-guanine dinucleotide biosynthesis protein A
MSGAAAGGPAGAPAVGSPAGIVLCGGRSSRMGRDKATLPLDGVPMAARVAAALAGAGADPIVCAGGDPGALGALGLVVVPDREPGAGPLAGLVSALDALHDAPVVVSAPCDLAWLDAGVAAALLAALAADPRAAVAVPRWDDGRIEPLCAAWRPALARGPLAAALEGGIRAVRDVLAAMPVVAVRAEPFAAALRNVNRPADLAPQPESSTPGGIQEHLGGGE